MRKYKFISDEQFAELKEKPIELKYQNPDHNEGLATYFREYIRLELTQWCKENKRADGEPYDLYRDGLKIYTTINSHMQRYAEDAVKDHLTYLQREFYNHWKGRIPWGKNE